MKKRELEKLHMWQDRLARNASAYSAETAKMDRREALYLGQREITPITRGARKEKTAHVRNICAELIEAQVDSSIPQPKVTARWEKDEKKAKLIEDMLRNEMDRMPFEQLNDMLNRTVPIQGGAAILVEWDNTEQTQTTVGELSVSVIHPKQIVPQDGVYTGIEDMDYVILKVPQTKEYIQRRYGVDVMGESETEPEVKGAAGAGTADDMVTQYVAYYRNDSGGIGLYSWVGDVSLEDIEDYQARRLRRCAKCGAVEPLLSEPAEETGIDGTAPFRKLGEMRPEDMERIGDAPVAEGGFRRGRNRVCPYCGSGEWTDSEEEYEELYVPVMRSDGTYIPGAQKSLIPGEGIDPRTGMPAMILVEEPTKIPFYKPDIYPLILQKNVSVYGRFLGDSDIDKIEDQQNTTNRIEAKIIDKLCAAGSYITLPDDASIKVDEDDMKVIRPGDAASKALIDVYSMEADVTADIAYLAQIYEEARQVIGITDSFQGRQDTTATSGKAKEFAAAQSAGRLESKRVMKDAAFAALFEAMFKFKLAYADEPRPVLSSDIHGNTIYGTFNRYDFLEQDDIGEWYWNDQFLFSCDTSSPLASNREAMWQETRSNLQTGAFGDPSSLQTLVLFWGKMELLHYPGAGETRAYLEEEIQRQAQAQAQMQAQAQAQAQMQAQAQAQAQMQAQAQAQQVQGGVM